MTIFSILYREDTVFLFIIELSGLTCINHMRYMVPCASLKDIWVEICNFVQILLRFCTFVNISRENNEKEKSIKTIMIIAV